MGLATLEEACKVQFRHLCDLFRKSSSITQDACTELLDYLQQDHGTFSSDQHKELARLAVSRCEALQNQGGAAASEDENQTNNYLHLYYPDWLWSVLRSDESMTNKLSHEAEFWVKHLGLRNACEITKRLGVAIGQVASGQAIDPQLGYNQLHDLHDAITRKRRSNPGRVTLKSFPKDPNEFWRMYPTAYTATHPPAPCRINETELFERNSSSCIPARSTNRRIKGKQDMSQSVQRDVCLGISNNDNGMAQAMQMMMKFMMGNVTPPLLLQQALGVQRREQVPHVFSGSHQSNPHQSPQHETSTRVEEVSTGSPSQAEPQGQSGAPSDAGGLPPAVLRAPSKEQVRTSGRMHEIRGHIQAAVHQTRSKRKRGTSSKRSNEDEDTDDTDDDPAGPPNDGQGRRRGRPKGSGKKHTCMKTTTKMNKDLKGETNKTHKATIKSQGWRDSPDLNKILNKTSAKVRPKYSEKPTHYHGGKIYWSKSKMAFRVYLRNEDLVEKQVKVGELDQKSKSTAFQYSCGLIEVDPRPVS